jgi:tripartite-type tricarboxylate transporter receptor subunit TctC
MNLITKRLLTGGAALAFALVAGPALAQTYPEKAVRLIVPFPPGSATDMAARVVAQQLQGALGQPFVVDNKPGAGGSIAGAEVVRAAPDGYTLLFSSNSAVASNVALLKSIPYDPMKDFSPIAGIGENMLVLMVKSSFPAKNLAEFVAYAKARPGKLSAGYGSSTSQVSISLLNKLAGLDTASIPYKGIPLAVNDVVGGTTDFTFVDLGNALAQAKGGNLRPIAVTSDKRNPLVPDWPTIQESYPGFDVRAWFAVVGPANMPKAVVDKLNAAMVKALAQPDTKERFATIGIAPMPLAPDKLHGFMGSEIAKWQRLVKEANVQPE